MTSQEPWSEQPPRGPSRPAQASQGYVVSSGAYAVSVVFKVAALGALLAGVLLGSHVYRTMSNNLPFSASTVDYTVGGIVAATILLSATLAFFGYVLTLLIALNDKP